MREIINQTWLRESPKGLKGRVEVKLMNTKVISALILFDTEPLISWPTPTDSPAVNDIQAAINAGKTTTETFNYRLEATQ